MNLASSRSHCIFTLHIEARQVPARPSSCSSRAGGLQLMSPQLTYGRPPTCLQTPGERSVAELVPENGSLSCGQRGPWHTPQPAWAHTSAGAAALNGVCRAPCTGRQRQGAAQQAAPGGPGGQRAHQAHRHRGRRPATRVQAHQPKPALPGAGHCGPAGGLLHRWRWSWPCTCASFLRQPVAIRTCPGCCSQRSPLCACQEQQRLLGLCACQCSRSSALGPQHAASPQPADVLEWGPRSATGRGAGRTSPTATA